MSNNGNKPLGDEYRSSQLYKALKGSGSQVADAIAQGLGKAAEELDSALNGAAERVVGNGSYTRTPPPGTPGGPQTGGPQTGGPQTGGPQTGGRQTDDYSYHYAYQGGQQGPTPQPRRPQTPGYSQQTAHPGQKPMGVNPAPAPQMPPMKVVRRGSPMKFYLVAMAALVYAWNFPIYELFHLIPFAAVMGLVFLIGRSIFKGKKEFVPVETETPKAARKAKKNEKKKAEEKPVEKPPEEKKSTTGDPEVDKIIDDGREYLRKLRAANDAIPDEALTEDITRMENASADIFRYIAAHPNKAPEIRKFMSYYLPTTLKLLNSYQRLAAQSVKGENITSTMFNIAGMMHTVADAFEKQLDALFTDEAMDVSADISVFETLLKQEGYVDDKTEQKK